MSRSAVAVLSTLMALAAQWACGSPTSPLGPCETSSKAFSAVAPAFVALVTKVDYEQGIAPGGSEVSTSGTPPNTWYYGTQLVIVR